MNASKFSFDDKCLELARHLHPTLAESDLRPLAQEFQDAAEGFRPPEAADCPHCAGFLFEGEILHQSKCPGRP